MKTIQMKTGYAIYAPPALRKFLEMRASGTASKELLMQLSADAMVEQEAEQKRERAAKAARRNTLDDVVIDFSRARQGREQHVAAKD
jgi:hypothetical protein